MSETIKIEIEKGIPIPSAQFKSGYSQALKSMKPGESFVVETAKICHTVRSAAAYVRVKITCRKIPHGKMRVWKL